MKKNANETTAIRRRYFVEHYQDFGNTFTLFYVESEEDLNEVLAEGKAQQITRKQAEDLAKQADSYGSKVISPYKCDADYTDPRSGYTVNGVIVEKIKA